MTTPSIALGNWSKTVQDFVKGKTLANYTIADLEGDKNPGPDSCKKNFMATYKCGNFATLKTINIPGEARGQTAIFDCTEENKMCTGLRLTLGDDGNLVLTDADNKQLWASNTSKTGLALTEFSAPQSKYGRNYLLAGETLNLNEFMGSPTGNCYLIMANTPEGNGLQLKYSVLNCDAAQYGNDDTANGLFSLAKTAYNELVGVKNKIKPKMEKLSKTLPVAEELFSKQTSQLQTDTHTYLGVVTDRQKIHKHIKQLDAMDEDSGLLLTRYKYRRIVWLALVIVLMFGGIKLVRNNS